MSAPADLDVVAAAPTSAIDEVTLARGYGGDDLSITRPFPIVDACACGLDIVAVSGHERDVLVAVMAHRLTPEHADLAARWAAA